MGYEIWIGVSIAVLSALIIGGMSFIHSIYRLIVSMDISLKNLTEQNESIVGKIDGHSKELVGLKVDVADLRGQLHGLNQKRDQ